MKQSRQHRPSLFNSFRIASWVIIPSFFFLLTACSSPLSLSNVSSQPAGALFATASPLAPERSSLDQPSHSQAFSRCHLPSDQQLRAVVKLYSEEGDYASAVVLGEGRLITVAHAVAGRESVLANIEGTLKRATVVARDVSLDLAMLKVNTGSLPALELTNDYIESSDAVWAVGFPLGMEQRTSLGVVQGVSHESIYASAFINSGASGGALLRCERKNGKARFELAGVLKGFLAQNLGGEAVNLGDSVSVSATEIKRFSLRATAAQRYALQSTRH